MGGFLFGYLLGFLTVVAVAVFLCWLLLRGANRGAVAKFLEGASMAMGNTPIGEGTGDEGMHLKPADSVMPGNSMDSRRDAFAGLVQEGGYEGIAGTANGKRIKK